MPITFPANVIAQLARYPSSVIANFLLMRDYFNADTRLIVDVSDDVAKEGQFINQSTIKTVDWKVTNFTVSMKSTSGKYSRDRADSIWAATFAREPEECAVLFRLLLPMPDGSLYELHRCAGSVEDCVAREESDIAVVDIVAKHLSHGPLTQKITKSSGDELVVLGTVW